MDADEKAIRALIARWMEASVAGDIETVLGLMTEDAVFMVPGAEPFGRAAFRAAAATMTVIAMTGTNEVGELKILGGWAYARSRIDVTMTPPDGTPVRRTGYALTLFRKDEDGQWRLARDANLLTAAPA